MEVLLVSGISDAEDAHIPFSVVVTNSVTPHNPKTYSTYVLERGILLGGLRRLQDCGKDFMFTYTEDPNYGPFLQSVNGLAGNPEQHTYWELLGKKPNGPIIRLDVGIGCYIPCANEEIILNYTKY
ncbi:transcobalamin-1-like [Perca fluviatilis]|uniref:transcobalamin-1-like n=1 Tax=Perca fluviatilis TaxID=8168 RepID=UPI001966B43B|nr:transcobalamin-1-like [Perca fluviatilis]XP_039648469.1 transcobalamin-1-like [Perca fluviatilis]XP_039648471.1 transcobalamin-1-like [Perca fluviatilis]XP_039648472.1 transcobalamin-1-like [Perca fluviatilis]